MSVLHMTFRPFKEKHIPIVREALDIAEDRTGDYYKFSFGQWKRHRYDVKTLSALDAGEISSYAFALLNKCSREVEDFDFRTKIRDFYFICLQDHQIQKALSRDRRLNLLPLLIYVFTHELVHIVRFCGFSQRFEVSGRGREQEEKLVHAATFKILKGLSLVQMDYVLESYRGHRVCDMALS